MKTLRKRNAIVGFGTQSARDALESKAIRRHHRASATQIFTATRGRGPKTTAMDSA